MSKLKVEYLDPSGLKPYAGNAKVHTEEQVESIIKSISEFGFNDPIAIDEDGVIIEGHGRLVAAKRLAMETVPVIRLGGLTEDQKRAYILVHNKLTMDTGFDPDKLKAELDKISDISMDDFGFDAEVDDLEEELEERYSQNIGKVIYEPKDTDWTAADLYEQTDRFDDMIEALDCDDDLKEMLRIRSRWFCEFNFARIADYYAHQATPQEQRVFEALGMVLLDKDQLIENGFASIVEDL